MDIKYFDLKKQRVLISDKLIVALGIFDGLHLAHQKIINTAITQAKSKNIKSAVITFDPHPDYILKKRINEGYLTPLSEKIIFMEKLGLDYLIVINFTLEVSRLSYEDFENQILNIYDIDQIVVGFDYSYGYKGLGSVETLKNKYNVLVIKEQTFENNKVGSNLIRKYLSLGNVEKTKELLGRYYNISGIVEKGSQIGQKIGFRTANIILNENYQTLKEGVYGVIVYVNNSRFLGVCNIGHNPSINYVKNVRLEVHILDFEGNIYDQNISVDFVKYLRDETIFKNGYELAEQIKKDVGIVRASMGDLL